MAKGATLIYAWEVIGTSEPRDFHFDQHGHTTPAPGQAMTVATYRQAFGLRQQGALTAPFDGIEGWQFSNSSEQPRSEEHTSELQSLMRISYAVFCLKNNKQTRTRQIPDR